MRLMSIFQPSRSAWTGRALSVLRIVAGLIFFSAGTMKLFGYPASPVPIPPFGLLSLTGVAGLLEVFGGLAIVVGFLTRPVAFVLAGEMAVAYFIAHAPVSFFPTRASRPCSTVFCSSI